MSWSDIVNDQFGDDFPNSSDNESIYDPGSRHEVYSYAYYENIYEKQTAIKIHEAIQKRLKPKQTIAKYDELLDADLERVDRKLCKLIEKSNKFPVMKYIGLCGNLGHYETIHKLICRRDIEPDLLINTEDWPTTVLSILLEAIGDDVDLSDLDIGAKIRQLINLGARVSEITLKEKVYDIQYLVPLYDAGLDFNQVINLADHYTMLHFCCECGKSDILSTLVKYEPDFSALTRDGQDCLQLAMLNMHVEICEVLIDSPLGKYPKSRLYDANMVIGLIKFARGREPYRPYWSKAESLFLQEKKSELENEQFHYEQYHCCFYKMSEFAQGGYSLLYNENHFQNRRIEQLDWRTTSRNELLLQGIVTCSRIFGPLIRGLTLELIKLYGFNLVDGASISDGLCVLLFCVETFFSDAVFTSFRPFNINEALDLIDDLTKLFENLIRDQKLTDLRIFYHYINLLLKLVYERNKPYSIQAKKVKNIEIVPLNNLGDSVERCLLLLMEIKSASDEIKLDILRKVARMDLEADGLNSSLVYNLIKLPLDRCNLPANYSRYHSACSLLKLMTTLLNEGLMSSTNEQINCFCKTQFQLQYFTDDCWFLKESRRNEQLIIALFEAVIKSGSLIELHPDETSYGNYLINRLNGIERAKNINKIRGGKLSCLAAKVIIVNKIETKHWNIARDHLCSIRNHLNLQDKGLTDYVSIRIKGERWTLERYYRIRKGKYATMIESLFNH